MKTDGDGTVEKIGGNTVFVGSTPRGIRRQHFREMSDQLGFFSEVDFAKAVVESCDSDRRKMLKRFYVNRNPDLSALPCFKTKIEMTEVASDNEGHDFKRARRSVQKLRTTESNKMPKNSEKTLRKRRAKTEVLRKAVPSKANHERHEIQRLDIDSSFGRKVHLASASSKGKKERDLKKRTCAVGETQAFKNKNMESVINLNVKKCRTDSKARLVIETNKQQEEDEECSSIDNADSITSVSILDEFLATDSCKGVVKSEKVHKIEREKDCNTVKQDNQKQMAVNKETVKNWKSTSVLDEFI